MTPAGRLRATIELMRLRPRISLKVLAADLGCSITTAYRMRQRALEHIAAGTNPAKPTPAPIAIPRFTSPQALRLDLDDTHHIMRDARGVWHLYDDLGRVRTLTD